jgi:hypothetical protein
MLQDAEKVMEMFQNSDKPGLFHSPGNFDLNQELLIFEINRN